MTSFRPGHQPPFSCLKPPSFKLKSRPLPLAPASPSVLYNHHFGQATFLLRTMAHETYTAVADPLQSLPPPNPRDLQAHRADILHCLPWSAPRHCTRLALLHVCTPPRPRCPETLNYWRWLCYLIRCCTLSAQPRHWHGAGAQNLRVASHCDVPSSGLGSGGLRLAVPPHALLW